MKDQYGTRMFANLFNSHYDSYCPEYSHTLVNSVRSYVNSKLGHERKTIKFITQLRQKLYFIHEYNCQVAKVTHKYPRSKKFDLLLIKYVELEFDALYNNESSSVQNELTTELRILRLLQVMLYPAVLNNEPLVSRNTDEVVKKAVLQLLGEVRSRYLVKNKLVCNIASKLLKKIDGNGNEFDFKRSSKNISRILATSDYGTDDSDSDIENEILFKTLDPINNYISTTKKLSSCIKVPLISSGIASIPTVEFVDDDNYLVYLEKQLPRKRKMKNKDNYKTVHKKRKNCPELRHNFVSNKNGLLAAVTSDTNFDTRNCSSSKDNHKSAAFSRTDDACVIVCSDSEDENSNKTLNVHNITSKQKIFGANQHTGKGTKVKSVVTFEILDDDSDSDHTNYMVYLQKEVKTNQKGKKQKSIDTSEIIVCSDSEDDFIDDKSADTTKVPQSTLLSLRESGTINSVILDTEENFSNANNTVPLVEAQCSLVKNKVFKNYAYDKCVNIGKFNGTSSENGFISLNDQSVDSELKVEGQVDAMVENIKNSSAGPLQSDISSDHLREPRLKVEVQELDEIIQDIKNSSPSSSQDNVASVNYLREQELKTEVEKMNEVVNDVENSNINGIQNDIICDDVLKERNMKIEIQEMNEIIEDTKNLVIAKETSLPENICHLRAAEPSVPENSYVNKKSDVIEKERDDEKASISTCENSTFCTFDGDRAITNESTGAECLTYLPVVFEKAQLNKNEQVLLSLNSVPFLDRESQEKNVLGGPLLSERIDGLESVDNISECRINDTLLEEFLLEDTFTLAGRKEFEELEYFLFNDSTDKQGSYLATFSFDDSEIVLQPETFDADIKSLESFLDDSQLISSTDCQVSDSQENHDGLFEIHRSDKLESDRLQASNICNFPNGASVDQKKRLNCVPCGIERVFQTPVEHSKKTKKR